jgi:mannose-6-phosphate isomerase-like protein (cupin superfamily)
MRQRSASGFRASRHLGEGRLIVDDEEQMIGEGDCALIPPGARHKVFNVGAEPLRIGCACSLAYSHEDTCLTE